MGNGVGKVFNNPDVVAQSWYVAIRSSQLKPKQLHPFQLGTRKLLAYRDLDGVARVVDKRCPHLGADLSLGCVVESGLQCAFHHWIFGETGECVSAPGYDRVERRSLITFPTVERWGLVWFFNGPKPLYDLPEFSDSNTWKSILLPSQHIRCHPHLVIGNGLDVEHFRTLHGMTLQNQPQAEETSPQSIRTHFVGRPNSRLATLLMGTRSRPIDAHFTALGGSIACMDVWSPTEFHVIFTGRPDASGQCDTQTIVFYKSRRIDYVTRVFALTLGLVKADRQVLDTLEFSAAFAPQDVSMRRYVEHVESYKTW